MNLMGVNIIYRNVHDAIRLSHRGVINVDKIIYVYEKKEYNTTIIHFERNWIEIDMEYNKFKLEIA